MAVGFGGSSIRDGVQGLHYSRILSQIYYVDFDTHVLFFHCEINDERIRLGVLKEGVITRLRRSLDNEKWVSEATGVENRHRTYVAELFDHSGKVALREREYEPSPETLRGQTPHGEPTLTWSCLTEDVFEQK